MTEERADSSDPAESEAVARVGTRVASYEIEELLGEGGMGAVYRARHVHMRNAVALKLLHPEVAEFTTVAARFEREAVAAARIEHPNIAQALDFGKLDDGSFYLVLEYVHGSSLSEVIAAGALPPAEALGIARQIADGIGAAHEAGIVHRDLKPDNVVLAEREGEAAIVKVLDFGIAKLVADEPESEGEALTKMGSIVGTPEYIAPEQAGGGAVDGRADLYALGVMLYEMLAGRLPFVAESQVGLITQHLVEPPPPLPPSVPPNVAQLVLQMLEKEPDARPELAARVVERIDAILGELAAPAQEPDDTIAGTTVVASAPARSRTAVWAVAVAAGALVVIALLGAVVVRGRPEVKTLRHAALAVHVPKIQPPAPVEPPAAPKKAVAAEAKAKTAAKTQRPTVKRPTAKKTAKPKKKKKNTVAGIYIPPPSEWF